jgi:F420-dependent oxidoreductase-like protein
VRFGLQIPRYTWQGGPAELAPRLRRIATAAEAAGFEQLWVMDHFRQIPTMGRPWEDMLESWTTLAYLAGVTETIRLGTLVTGVTYRNVAHLAKIVATLDVLSGGRAICGLGAAWFREEHLAYGWRFPSVRERYALLEDALRLLPLMWGPGAPAFEGKAISVPEAMCYPRPLQAKVPLLVGGSGERTTLRLVARLADACNLFGEAPTVAHKVEVLHRHCAEVGRDPAEIEVTQLSTVLVGGDDGEVRSLVDGLRPPRMSAERFARQVNAGTVEQHARRVRDLVAAGVSTVIVSLADLDGPEAVDRFAGVIAHFPASSSRRSGPTDGGRWAAGG